jgi:Protein of unknown function (DUF2848)
MSLRFTRHSQTAVTEQGFEPDALVIAGWTGRDPAAVQHHIEELAALGVPAPSTVPLFYRVAAQQLTQATAIEVVGEGSSGEVEPVLVAMADGLWLGVGSDHTDRAAEAYSVALSKQLCPKPLGGTLWRFEELAGHWDALVLRSYATRQGDRQLYQEGPVSGLRPPPELVDRFTGGRGLAPGNVMFCGTVPARNGIHPADLFEIELHDPVLGRTLRHQYEVRSLPVVC